MQVECLCLGYSSPLLIDYMQYLQGRDKIYTLLVKVNDHGRIRGPKAFSWKYEKSDENSQAV
jgi:hypothetical protein